MVDRWKIGECFYWSWKRKRFFQVSFYFQVYISILSLSLWFNTRETSPLVYYSNLLYPCNVIKIFSEKWEDTNIGSDLFSFFLSPPRFLHFSYVYFRKYISIHYSTFSERCRGARARRMRDSKYDSNTGIFPARVNNSRCYYASREILT